MGKRFLIPALHKIVETETSTAQDIIKANELLERSIF
jgi:hypothetical protein